MGSGDYGLKNYFNQNLKYRYGYYRKSTAGHNTLTFDNDGLDNSNRGACDQDPGSNGITGISLFVAPPPPAGTGTGTTDDHSGSDASHAAAVQAQVQAQAQAQAQGSSSSASPAYSIVDLTAAYGPQNSSRVERGFAFTESYEHLLIVDEFEFASGSSVRNVTWSMHTMASIQLLQPGAAAGAGAGAGAVLSLGGAKLHATVLEPLGAVFSSAAVDLQLPQKPSAGVSKLQVHLSLAAAAAASSVGGAPAPAPAAPVTRMQRIVVGLSLSATRAAVKPGALEAWKAAGPFGNAAYHGN